MKPPEPPLVSIIVRSTGRPGLTAALDSIVQQDYLSIETVLVDAACGIHSQLRSLPQSRGRTVRTFGGDRHLSPAQSANIGLQAARGDWLCFLDDNGTYDRDFVSATVKAAGDHPASLVAYGQTRILGADGQVDQVFGEAFNRELLHLRPLFCLQAALIRRKVVELGCRFDEAFEMFEDRDFFAQIAQYSDFALVPVVGFNLADPETSGIASASRDIAKSIRFERLLHAKAAGARTYHARRASRLYARAAGAYGAGDPTRSRELLEQLLHEYPNDPNGLNGLARIELENGSFERAEMLVSRAVAANPSAAEYRLTRAMILGRLGRLEDAKREATLAAKKQTLRSTAESLLRQWGATDPSNPPAAVVAHRAQPADSRLVSTTSNNEDRYDRRTVSNAALTEADRIAEQARRHFVRGEALHAKAILDSLAASAIGSPELSRAAGKICLELRSFEQAYAFLDRSAKSEPSKEAAALLGACCNLLWKDRARASAHAMVLRLRERIEKRAIANPPQTTGPIHVLGTLGMIGGSETRAVSLYRTLSGHAEVRLWSTDPPLERQYSGLPIQVLEPARGTFPNGGTLVLAGHYFPSGDWWCEATFDRVVICVNLDLPLDLVHRMTEIEESPHVSRIDFTFPSQLSRDISGLPGQIEYSFADVSRFTRTVPPPHTAGSRLIIGRHSRDLSIKHHPNDPALYRQLVARGHRVRLLGGTCLQKAFSGDSTAQEIELRPTGSEDARDFLEGLDCFIYRKHPLFLETGGTAILEAMAMALPVVVFREGVGAAEYIQHEEDGFLVDTEEEALAVIDRLAAHPGLREGVGAAARCKVTAIMGDQQEGVLAYYLDRPDRSG